MNIICLFYGQRESSNLEEENENERTKTNLEPANAAAHKNEVFRFLTIRLTRSPILPVHARQPFFLCTGCLIQQLPLPASRPLFGPVVSDAVLSATSVTVTHSSAAHTEPGNQPAPVCNG